MRKSVLSVIFYLILLPSLYSQSRWIDLQSIPLLPSDRYEDMFFINSQTGYVVHISGKIYKTTNGGRTFALRSTRTGAFYRSIGFFDENTGFVGTLTDSLPMLRTTNGGINFTKITNISGPSILNICGISVVNSTTAYAVGRYFCPAYFVKTTDKGESWTSVSVDPLMIKSIVDCHFWSADSGIVVGGYNPSNVFSISNSVVLFTSNGGQSFSTVFKSTRTGEWGWKISFVNKLTGFVSVESLNRAVVLKTTNAGMNWTERVFTTTEDLEGIGFINENTGWIGGWEGPTYQTTNSGASWVQVPWGRYLNRFRFISDTLGYAIGSSFYKFTQESVSIQQISSEMPGRINLYQNYPNPFNPETRINYEMRLTDLVTLKIFNALGVEIKTLVNEIQKPGIYSASFDGSDYPSGIYYYKLETAEFSDSKKMVLVK